MIASRSHLFVCFFTFGLFSYTIAVVCFDCRADDSTCNVGQCHGMVCLKMETSNMDNERRTVHKSCGDDLELTQCKQSGFGSKLISRCSCAEDFCNGDDRLNAAGLQPLAGGSPSSSTSASVLLSSLLFLFV